MMPGSLPRYVALSGLGTPRISSWSAAAFGALAEAVFFARVPLLYRASARSVASLSWPVSVSRCT
jgi:hypothetical protein